MRKEDWPTQKFLHDLSYQIVNNNLPPTLNAHFCGFLGKAKVCSKAYWGKALLTQGDHR